MRFFYSALLLTLGVSSGVAQTKSQETEAYIQKYQKVAVKEMKRSGIPASITLAQGILESANGKSKLAMEAKNHFGIKCADNWSGPSVRMDDDQKDECFRKYRKVKKSFQDHSAFISKRERYKFLFDLDPTDYNGWAAGLKKAGYATNPKYPQLLIGLIEKYDLSRYDRKGKARAKYEEDSIPAPSKAIKTHRVGMGDTMYSIAKQYNMTVQELQDLNHKSSSGIEVGEVLQVK